MIGIINLFILFFKIGIFSFGGGYVMLPLIYQGIQQFGFMSGEEFSRIVALSQVTPGPIAINAATYVGYQYAGYAGAVSATLGVIAPSLILIILISHFINKFKESPGLNSILSGIRPATVGLLASAVVLLAQQSIYIDSQLLAMPALIFIITVILSGRFKIHPITLTILGGIAGAFLIR